MPDGGRDDEVNGWQSFPSLFRPDLVASGEIELCNRLRNEFMSELDELGVSTRPATHAVHLLSYFKNHYRLQADNFPAAYAADQCSISLPLFNGMTSEEVAYVVETVLEVSNKYSPQRT